MNNKPPHHDRARGQDPDRHPLKGIRRPLPLESFTGSTQSRGNRIQQTAARHPLPHPLPFSRPIREATTAEEQTTEARGRPQRRRRTSRKAPSTENLRPLPLEETETSEHKRQKKSTWDSTLFILPYGAYVWHSIYTIINRAEWERSFLQWRVNYRQE